MGVDANTLLRLTDLTVDFESQEGVVHAVDKVSFSVAPGELVGLVGESGCGKSVTASAILGLTRMVNNATISGTIEFLGRDLVALPESEVRDIRGKDISMIFQDPVTSLNPVLSIERLMTEGLEVHLGLSHADAVKRSIELLQLVGIPKAAGRIKDYPHQFSGGMRQRVMIAIALSCNPKLLLADEPTTALDVTIQAQALRLDGDVEGGGGLVGEQQLGVAREGDGDHHALAHAAGELVRVVLDAAGCLGNADQLQELDRALDCVGVRQAEVDLEALGHEPLDAEHRVQARDRVL